MRTKKKDPTLYLTVCGVMAALAFVTNYIRFPFLDSQITIANTVCVLCGLILTPGAGFLTAGMGALIYDLLAGWGAECFITFVNKGMIALVTGFAARKLIRDFGNDVSGETMKPMAFLRSHGKLVLACALGTLTYVALYMLKTYIFCRTIDGLTQDATWVKMGLKFPASLINAGFATVVAPIFYQAVMPALKRTHILSKIR